MHTHTLSVLCQVTYWKTAMDSALSPVKLPNQAAAAAAATECICCHLKMLVLDSSFYHQHSAMFAAPAVVLFDLILLVFSNLSR